MKCTSAMGASLIACRTSHGVRGLKYSVPRPLSGDGESHLAWGAWIEIYQFINFFRHDKSRTSHGVRGLKYIVRPRCNLYFGRTSHGVRGLKLVYFCTTISAILSHLAWGAWIEIPRKSWIVWVLESHLAWGAWIEMSGMVAEFADGIVAPRMGCVD